MWKSMRRVLGSLVKRSCGIETVYGHTFAPSLFGENPLVVDFGCNRGEFAYAFRQRFSCQYLAADANPQMVAAASERLGLYVEHVAVGGHDGQTEFFLADNPEASSIYPSIAGPGGQGRIQVPLLSYASWSQKHGIDTVALLKLDIEGAELELLENWDGRIARPDQIAVEFHDFLDSSQRPRVRACIDRLRSYGYECLNATRPHHTDCLFIDKARLGDVRGLLLRFRWHLLTAFHVIRGWIRSLETRRHVRAFSATRRD